MNLKDFIRSIPDYPKKGILFRDITTLIKNENAFEETINQIVKKAQKFDFNFISTYADNDSIQCSNLFIGIPKTSCLNSAAVSKGFGVKIQNYILACIFRQYEVFS